MPQERLVAAITALSSEFPTRSLFIHVEALGAVVELVLDGRCSVGVAGTLPVLPDGLSAERLFGVEMVTVAAPDTPLTRHPGPIPLGVAGEQAQIVLTDRSTLTKDRGFGVQSPHTWRVADLGAKLGLIRAGLGWGHMPLPMVAEDLAAGRLRRLELEGPSAGILPMQAIYPSDRRPGPAGRRFLEALLPGS